MFREHLVAYLDGLERSNLDSNFRSVDSANALLLGRFYGEGVSLFGSRVELQADLDGDGHDETVKFWFSHFNYNLSVTKFDKTLHLQLPAEISDETTGHFHLALKDVTNDGLPEILLAFTTGPGDLTVAVWGFNEGRQARELVNDKFCLLEQLKGQYQARVLEGGTIQLPYGSVGFKRVCRWSGSAFLISDE